jgi:hypothetical protein
MLLPRVRRTGRVFAVALLLWTAVDLLDRRTCLNHADVNGVPSPAAPMTLGTSGAPTEPGHGHGAPAGHAGDCFCCSAFVDVQAPFLLVIASSTLWLEPPAAPHYVSVARPHLYRPPIAA